MDQPPTYTLGAPSALRTPSNPSGRIPISVLIEPTDAPAQPRRPSSNATASPNTYARPPPAIPTSSLYHPNPLPIPITTTQQPHHPWHPSPTSNPPSPTDPQPSPKDLSRRPRPPRPSYSEEQKFFIMFARIVRDLNWPDIEDKFALIFGTRSRGGLTSVYYRVRRDWGLMEVLKGGPGSYAADRREVERRAVNFSSEFLGQIGYIERS